MSRSASRLVRVLCSIWFTTVDAIIIRMNQPSRVANQQRKNTQCVKRSRMSGMGANSEVRTRNRQVRFARKTAHRQPGL